MSGQTYTRKIDSQILDTLSGLGQSAHKFATDVRLLAHRREIDEPFEEEQIGSSAMAYKRNPMRCERICSLARFVISLASNAAVTQSVQWFERTLDDSANRRLSLPQAFLGSDAVLRLLINVTNGLVVREPIIAKGVAEELPFMATESILMAAVASGGDRQALHEVIRQESIAAAERIKQGEPNDLIDRLKRRDELASVDWETVLDPTGYVGRAPVQVEQFLAEYIDPITKVVGKQILEDPGLHV